MPREFFTVVDRPEVVPILLIPFVFVVRESHHERHQYVTHSPADQTTVRR